jgi:hypothetical protein
LLIWLLYGSLPPHGFFPDSMLPSGKAFAVLDRLLDQARTGPFYLRQAAIAEMVVDSIHHHANTLHRYSLHAFVVMPNHVHMLMTPRIPLPRLTKALKGFTANGQTKFWGVQETRSGKRKATIIWFGMHERASASVSISSRTRYAPGW